jgi:hypothetical protein
MSLDTELVIGLGFLGLLGIFLRAYVAWKSRTTKKKLRRSAEEDAKLVELGVITESEFFQKVRSVVPSHITSNAVLASITTAAVFIIIVQIVFNRVDLKGMKLIEQGTLLAALCLAAVSAICWLLNLEQCSQMLAPSVDYDRLKKFQRYTYNLSFSGLVIMLISIYLFLLLANLYVAMVAGFVTLWIVIGYWKIHCGW